MRVKRFLLVSLLLFAIALAWNGLFHLVLLPQTREAVAHLLRPDFEDKLWLSLINTLALMVLFVWGYGRFARDASLREASRYGLFFALLAGSLVDANQYLLYPIPAWVAALWFLGGLVEFQLYALLLARLFPRAAAAPEGC